jgi:hypothetical protein
MERTMTREEAIARLKELQTGGDIDAEHCYADDVLCRLLVSLGYQDVVDEWAKIEKWYA